MKKEEIVHIARVEIEVANGIARRRQISPSARSGIPSAFSWNCLAGSSRSISGQKSRGALCRAESGWKRMPANIPLHPDGAILYRENSSRSVVPSLPCIHRYIKITRRHAGTVQRLSSSSLSSSLFLVAITRVASDGGEQNPLSH